MQFFLFLHERNVYAFMVDVGTTAAPTFLRSFLVSMTFCNFVLGLTGSDDAIASQRVEGCARESYLMKRKLQQRPPLFVAQVKPLELYVSGWAHHEMSMPLVVSCFVFTCVRDSVTCNT